MCRSTAESGPDPRDRDRLKIRAFYLRLSVAGLRRPLPDTLTLVYLPRIDGNLLEVNGSRIRADAPAIVPLHRIRSAEPPQSGAEAVFASTDRVRAGEGVRFEAYVGEEKAVRGVFRRGREKGGWGMECRCAAEGDVGVAAADVWVLEEKGVLMRQRVEVAAEEERRRRRRRRRGFCLRLEEIPEETEGCDCLCCEGDEEEQEREVVGSDGGDSKEGRGEGMEGEDVVLEMEGVRWAVDLGIWVMCLGVGLLVSRASYRSIRRKLI